MNTSLEYMRRCYQIDVHQGDRIEYRDYLGNAKQGIVARAVDGYLRVRIAGHEDPVNVHPQNVLRVVK